MAKDFFDEDLLRSNGSSLSNADSGDDGLVKPISDASLTRMIRQKDEVMQQVAGATQEIETLRQRQDRLEKEKNDLQELTRRQEEYERGKKEITEKLIQSLVLLEKEEIQATRMVELISMMRQKFKETLAELRGISESDWSDENFQLELNKALVVVEDAHSIYKKAMAKVDAAKWQRADGERSEGGFMGGLSEGPLASHGFAHWMTMGFAFSLPLLAILTVFFIIYMLMSMNGGL